MAYLGTCTQFTRKNAQDISIPSVPFLVAYTVFFWTEHNIHVMVKVVKDGDVFVLFDGPNGP